MGSQDKEFFLFGLVLFCFRMEETQRCLSSDEKKPEKSNRSFTGK